jgi:hypothetical protein
MVESKVTIQEEYELPSGGKIYEKPVNPHIKLRSMTVREEMKRLSPSNNEFKKMSDIIEACIVGEKPTVKVYDMCIGDYEYLLHKLRVVSHGNKYRMSVVCPNCGDVVDSEVDLDSLKSREFDLGEFRDLMNIHLDDADRDITIKFQTPRILDSINTREAEMKKRASEFVDVDYNLLATLEYAIDTVDGNHVAFTDKTTFIYSLSVKDMNKILNRLQTLNRKVGLDTDRVVIPCKKCNYEILTFFRYQSEFFRPQDN